MSDNAALCRACRNCVSVGHAITMEPNNLGGVFLNFTAHCVTIVSTVKDVPQYKGLITPKWVAQSSCV